MKINSFKDLVVWQKSMELTSSTYYITSQLPQKEAFGLSSQMQRASISIPSNIAEGSKRSSRLDFRQFCKIALGSAAELETQLLIVQRIYPSIDISSAIINVVEIQKMLGSLINKLVKNPEPINNKLKTTN